MKIKLKNLTRKKKRFILYYSKNVNLVGIEVLNASKSSINPAKVEYEVA